MKKSLFALSFVSCVTIMSMSGAMAQTPTQASSKPMGYVTYTAKGNSDTRIGAPVHRKAAFVGKVGSVSNNVITVDGTDPGWAADSFTDPTMATPPASELYFVLIGTGGTGNMEGRHFEITSNGSNTLTIDLAGETSFGTDVTSGTTLKVIPYWTLDTLFPGGEGVHPSSNFGTLNTEILIPSTMSAGINLSNSDTFFYYDGSLAPAPNPLWARFGSGPVNYGTQPLAPDVQVIVRHNVGGDTEIVPIGDVYTTAYRSLVNIISNGVDQDNAVFLTVPVDVSLNDSNLFQSGAFAGNTTFNAGLSDSLLVFDNTVASQNKSNAKTYFYYSGALGSGPGWRLAGGGDPIKNDDIVFSLDSQVIIRKKGGTPGSQIWNMTPSYLPLP